MVPDVQVHAAGQRGGGAPPHQRRIQVLYCTTLTVLYCTVLYCTVLYTGSPPPRSTAGRAPASPTSSSQVRASACVTLNMRFMY